MSDDDEQRWFHPGESAVQQRIGVRERMEQVAPAIFRDFMPAQHQEFFARLPTIFVGSLDERRDPWASVLVGWPGFVRALDDRTLRIEAEAPAGDALSRNLAPGAPLGILGIEPQTRRRNRLNGTVSAVGDGGFEISVDQSFGNCPQYIQGRRPEWQRDPGEYARAGSSQAFGGILPAEAAALLRRTDTFFLASAAAGARGHDAARGVDISHRGGRPGFVRVDEDAAAAKTRLVFPDFRGNFLFNTLGNLVSHPRAGLLAIHYESGDLVQLVADARIVWEGEEVEAFAGAERLVELRVAGGRFAAGALPLRWSPPVEASQLRDTGVWPGN